MKKEKENLHRSKNSVIKTRRKAIEKESETQGGQTPRVHIKNQELTQEKNFCNQLWKHKTQGGQTPRVLIYIYKSKLKKEKSYTGVKNSVIKTRRKATEKESETQGGQTPRVHIKNQELTQEKNFCNQLWKHKTQGGQTPRVLIYKIKNSHRSKISVIKLL